MITNFENETYELTEKELNIVPFLIVKFMAHGKSCPIKADSICRDLNISGPRLRKLTNHIRSKGYLPLIATSNGYYVSGDKEEIKKQIKSLQQRANSIMESARGLEKFLNN